MKHQSILKKDLTEIFGEPPARIEPLSGGCVGEVYRAQMQDGRAFVVKVDQSQTPVLAREAFMLRYLLERSELPVPQVIHDSPRLLVMEFLPGSSHFSRAAQQHAADLLAALHAISAPAFGLEQDTLIGGLHQPNPWTASWLDFFRENRLLFMAREALNAGRLPARIYARVEKLAGRLERWLEPPDKPSLIHGDVWTTNVLAQGDRITGFLDPAIYYAHPEIELAFITLFHTFDEAFFHHYAEQRPIAPGFWEARRDLYNLYPLLVHVRLFGGGYVGSVERILARFGV
ncbi:MAG: fructosamine kinase family protein [Chloroflexi bacterium]|nr:fructosamine kinase family protein [Chloroflexota bacterium]